MVAPFSQSLIPESVANSMKQKGIWRQHCPVGFQDLRLLTLSYIDFDGRRRDDGQMIVHAAYAEGVLRIFKEMLAIKFPVAKIRLIDVYGGDDIASMTDNNSSAFNYRKKIGKDEYSMHSYGLAIDINPVQNPYQVEATGDILPNGAKKYMDRTLKAKGMVEPVVSLFRREGFTVWGGDWQHKDYHHFQTPNEIAQKLVE